MRRRISCCASLRQFSDEDSKLYESLVDAVGAHQYRWIKVETLAVEFKADDSTIKRWLTVLEKHAKLIRRQRQFKTSSRTYLIAYDQYQVQAIRDDQAEHDASDEPTPLPTAPEDTAATVADDHAPQRNAATDAQAPDAASVFLSAMMRPRTAHLCTQTLRICHLTPCLTLVLLLVFMVVNVHLT